MTASLAASTERTLRRGTVLAVYVSLAAFHLSILVGPSFCDAADKPAAPAELQALSNQIAGLQGQLAAKEAELQAQNSKIADIKAKMLGLGALQDIGGGVAGGWNVGENVGMGGGRAALQFQLIAAESQRDAVAQQISSLQQQIAQVQATLTYWQNPVGTDIKNEREHLGNIENQPPPKDDFDRRQRQQDIDSSRQRIKELEDLERQFQQSQPGSQTTTSGQSVQPQGSSYTTPSSGFGPSGSTQPAGQQGQQPGYGPGPYDTGSFKPPKHGEIQETIQGSIGEKPGMSKPGGG
jgi:hypothetical protein